MATKTEPKVFNSADSLARNSVILAIKLSKPGNSKKVKPSMVEVDADPEAIHVSKELLDSPEMQLIGSLDGDIRRWLNVRSLPTQGLLKGGVYRVPLTLVDDVDRSLENFAGTRNSMIDSFIDTYPERIRKAQIRLRSLFDTADYPSVGTLRSMFGFEYRYLTFDVPEVLAEHLKSREREKAVEAITAEAEEIKSALREGFKTLLDHAVDRLGNNKDGKKKVFRDTLIANLGEFFTYFNDKNLVGDGELATLVEKARAVMEGVEVGDLRSDDGLRDSVRSKLDEVKAEMDRNITIRPRRRIRFTEDDGVV